MTGIELACWGNHLDPKRAAEDDAYVAEVKALLAKYDLQCVALCSHIIGQCVGDYNDPRLNNFAPPSLADQPDAIRAWAIETMKYCAIAAKKMGCYVVTGFHRITDLEIPLQLPPDHRRDDRGRLQGDL